MAAKKLVSRMPQYANMTPKPNAHPKRASESSAQLTAPPQPFLRHKLEVTPNSGCFLQQDQDMPWNFQFFACPVFVLAVCKPVTHVTPTPPLACSGLLSLHTPNKQQKKSEKQEVS
jgi:hypothetical protein